jgi:hypothetical protein
MIEAAIRKVMLPSNSQPMLTTRGRVALPNLMDGSCQWHCGNSGRELNAATGPLSVVLSLGLIAYAASSSRFGSQSYFIGQRPDLSAIFGELAPRDPEVLLCR